MNKLSLTALVFAFVLLHNISFGQKKDNNNVLITIGKEQVTSKEFMDVFSKNNVQNETIDKKTLDEYLELYINFKLKVKEAYALKMDTNTSFIEELAGYRTQLAKPYFNDSKVTEELLQEAYQRKLMDVRASHILVLLDKNASPEDTLAAYNKIVKIRERAINGENFGALAAETSEDPSAADQEAIPNQRNFRAGNKGDLGYFSVFDMVYPFENSAYSTEVGSISQPLRSEFGYHIIKVTDKKPASGLIEAAHIYVSLTPEANESEIAEKQEKINFIADKISKGMTFEQAAGEYSEDRGSATRDGLLTKFTVNRIVPEFIQTIKKLQIGEVSAPLRTMYGFHIVKLVGLEQPGSFEVEAPKLRERLSKDVRSQKSEEAVIQKIKTESKFKINEKNLQAFKAKYDTNLVKGEMDVNPFLKSKKPLFYLGKKRYTQADFANFIAKNQSVQSQTNPVSYGNKLFSEFVKESCLAYEDRQLEAKHPEFAAMMKEYRDGILLFDLMDKKVWSKAVKDTLGLQSFYDANKQNYMWNERVSATIYTITNNDELKRAINIIKTNNNDDDIRRKFEADSIISVRIQAGKFEKGDNKYVDSMEAKLGLSSEIYSDFDKATLLVRIHELLPPQPKLLDEAKGIITSDYQNFLEKQWIQELKAKYPVIVHDKTMNQLKSKY